MASLLARRRRSTIDVVVQNGRPLSQVTDASGDAQNVLAVRVQVASSGRYDVVSVVTVDRRGKMDAIADAAFSKLKTVSTTSITKSQFVLIDSAGKEVELDQPISANDYVARCSVDQSLPLFRLIPRGEETTAKYFDSVRSHLSISLPSVRQVFATSAASADEEKKVRTSRALSSRDQSASPKSPDQERQTTRPLRTHSSRTSSSNTASLGSEGRSKSLRVPFTRHSASASNVCSPGTASMPSESADSNKVRSYTPLTVEIPNPDLNADLMSSFSNAGSDPYLHPERLPGSPITPMTDRRHVDSETDSLSSASPNRACPPHLQEFSQYSSSGIIVKVILTQEWTTNVMCDMGMTFGMLCDKALAKLHRYSGNHLRGEEVYFVDGNGGKVTDFERLIEDNDYVKECKQKNSDATFRLDKASLPEVSSSAPVVPVFIEDDHYISLIEAYRRGSDDDGPKIVTDVASQDTIVEVQSPSERTILDFDDAMSVRNDSSIIGTKFVRLELPKGIKTNIKVTEKTTVNMILEKCSLKLKRVLGVTVPPSDLRLFAQEENEGVHEWVAVPDDIHLMNLEVVRHSGQGATLMVKCISNQLEAIPEKEEKTPTVGVTASPISPGPRSPRHHIVRVILPMDVITNVGINDNFTASMLILRGLAKLKTLKGEAFDESNFQVFLDTATVYDPVPLPGNCLLSQLPEVMEFMSDESESTGTVSFIIRPKPDPSNASQASGRRVSLSQIMARRQKVITPEDVFRDLQMMDGPNSRRKSFIIPNSQLGSVSKSSEAPQALDSKSPTKEAASPLTPTQKVLDISLLAHKKPQTTISEPAGFGEVPNIRVTAIIPDCKQQVSEFFRGEDTVKSVKVCFWSREPLQSSSINPDSCALYYVHPKENIPVYIVDDEQPLCRLAVVQECRKHEVILTVGAKDTILQGGSWLNSALDSLLGKRMSQLNAVKDFEVTIMRKRLQNVLRSAWKYLEADMPMSELATTPPSASLAHRLQDEKWKFRVRCHFPRMNATKTLSCDINDSTEKILVRILEKFGVRKNSDFFGIQDSEDAPEPLLGLQIQGQDQFLHPGERLIDHRLIRHYAFSGNLSLVLVEISPSQDGSTQWRDERSKIREMTHRGSAASTDCQFNLAVEEGRGTAGTHADLTLRGREFSNIRWISMWDLSTNLRMEIMKADGVPLSSLQLEGLFVEAYIAFGGKRLCASVGTHTVKVVANPSWQNSIIFDIPIYNIPRNARVCLTLYGSPPSKKRNEADRVNRVTPPVVLGGVSTLLIDSRGYLRQGSMTLRLWDSQKANVVGPCMQSRKESDPTITIRFEEYSHPVVFPEAVDTHGQEADYQAKQAEAKLAALVDEDMGLLHKILQWDSLVELDGNSRKLIWKHRDYLMKTPESLPKVLLSASWDQLEDALDVRRLLRFWRPISSEVALLLLDGQFADDGVRAFAVDALEVLTNDQLNDFILQLVQALAFEHRLDSALARFLLKRALLSCKIGHTFFWILKTELTKSNYNVLHSILLEAYLKGSRAMSDDLINQMVLVERLNDVALAVKAARAADRRDMLMNMLKPIPVVPGQIVPISYDLRVQEIRVEKCKVMDSKKLPLWIVFRTGPSVREVETVTAGVSTVLSPTGRPLSGVDTQFDVGTALQRPPPTTTDYLVIFKLGDDLRQDALTLQMMRIMDHIWRNADLNLRMNIYGCISTGKEQGFIEVVNNAETVSSIQIKYGGSNAAFKEEPLEKWIRSHNPCEADYDQAVKNFTLSCAGYCVATYCLGIGDRHNDNIMCDTSGRLFHIDFGHFLGNMKTKFGIKRERAPFVLTPDFVYVISHKNPSNFEYFVSTAVKAYQALRRNANIFINLFSLMLSTGIPELSTQDDLAYLQQAFCLGMTEEEAAEEFQSLIFESIRLGWSTQLNWWVHNLVHGKEK